MNGVLFEEWVRELDNKFFSEVQKCALVISDCSTHPQMQNLKSIRLFFILANTTSSIQSMGEGVIRSLKAQYPKNAVRKII